MLTSTPTPTNPQFSLHHHRLRREPPPLLRLSAAANPISHFSTKTSNNHTIQQLCKKGHLKQAIHLLFQEPNPTQLTYELLILTCARKRSFFNARIVHEHVLDNGFCQDSFLMTKLINMYGELREIGDARKVFDETNDKTVFVWNAIFRVLALAGEGEEVLGLYRRMNFGGGGGESDRFSYTYVLKACVASEGEGEGEGSSSLLMKGKEIHAQILRRGYGSYVHIMTTLVDVYARFGCVENARCVFREMPVRNLVSWSAMIGCYARNGRAMEALELFREMMVESDELVPNSVTMVSVLQACASLAALEQGKLIHGYVLRKGLDSILPVISALVTMYSRCGNLEFGKRVFDQMEERDVVSWNSMISSYGIHGLGREAIEIFRVMVKHGVSPSPISFVSVLGACSHAGLVDEGKLLFDSMVKDFKIQPTVEHYACMVDLLGRANRLDEAAKIIEAMQIEPGPKVWGSLLGSCRIHCNVELAERASSHLFELEPTNAGNYVLLADIYALAGMWEEVKSVKKLLDTKGLQKVSGCSWIEVNRKVYALTSVDEFNPQIEQIHAFLLKLATEMKDIGYEPQTNIVLYNLETHEKERILLGHSEKLAVAFGLINNSKGEAIRITKNLRLCEDCHSFTKFISKFTNREILVRDTNRFHHFHDGVCSCEDYW